jgi:sirohydrochlorin cobaltochelatase
MSTKRRAVLLVGHGAIAKDTPPQLLDEWRSLRAARRATKQPPSERERELLHTIESWPRSVDNDPYKAGIEGIAHALARRLGDMEVAIAFNELCQPGVVAAIDGLAGRGVGHIVVLTTMITPGGGHSERDIPAALSEARQRHPTLELSYLWPFDVELVAEMMAASVQARR